MADTQRVRTEYERILEDAILALCDELTAEQVTLLQDEAPHLMEFCEHLHHSTEHEQAMVRRSYWSQYGERRTRLMEDHRNGYHAHLRPNDCPLCLGIQETRDG